MDSRAEQQICLSIIVLVSGHLVHLMRTAPKSNKRGICEVVCPSGHYTHRRKTLRRSSSSVRQSVNLPVEVGALPVLSTLKKPFRTVDRCIGKYRVVQNKGLAHSRMTEHRSYVAS